MADSFELQRYSIADEKTYSINARYYPENRRCHLEIESDSDGHHLFEGHDYWECLTRMRETFEAEGKRILCNGCRKDVGLSGMCRDMGAGLQAYELSMSREPTGEDLVKTFDYAPLEKIGVIEEQREFYQTWLRRNDPVEISSTSFWEKITRFITR